MTAWGKLKPIALLFDLAQPYSKQTFWYVNRIGEGVDEISLGVNGKWITSLVL